MKEYLEGDDEGRDHNIKMWKKIELFNKKLHKEIPIEIENDESSCCPNINDMFVNTTSNINDQTTYPSYFVAKEKPK